VASGDNAELSPRRLKVSTERPSLQPEIESAARAIEEAEALVITAGAGMGVDSGLPDYRGNQGLWRAYPKLQHLGLSFEAMATPVWFERNPRMAWAFYGHRRQLYRETQPHRGHALLREWGATMSRGYFVFTSNVDGHFERAGFSADRVVECHGNIHRNQCGAPCHDAVWQDAGEELDIDLEQLEARGPLPRCPKCGAIARPNMLMFNDWSWIGDVTEAQMARYAAWVERLRRTCARVAIVELGAGTRLPTIRYESQRLAAELNGTLVRINLREPEGPEGTIELALPALEALERIEHALGR
jgi:NAD-dependent SIR2 family protein deacetylase